MNYNEMIELAEKIISADEAILLNVTDMQLNFTIQDGEHKGVSLAMILARTEKGLQKLLAHRGNNATSLFCLMKNKTLPLKMAIQAQNTDMFDTLIINPDVLEHIADDDNAILRYAKEIGTQETIDKLSHIQLQRAMHFGNWKQVYTLLAKENINTFNDTLMLFISCTQKHQLTDGFILYIAKIIIHKWNPDNNIHDDKRRNNLQNFILKVSEKKGYAELLKMAVCRHEVEFKEMLNTKKEWFEQVISDLIKNDGDVETTMQLKELSPSAHFDHLLMAAENGKVAIFKKILTNFKFTNSSLDVLVKQVLITPIITYQQKAFVNISMLSIMVRNGYRLSKDTILKLINNKYVLSALPPENGVFFQSGVLKRKIVSERDILFNVFDIKTKILMANNIGTSYLDDGVNDFINNLKYLKSLVDKVNNKIIDGNWDFENIELCSINYETLSECIEILEEMNTSSSLLTAALLLSRVMNSEQLSFKNDPGIEEYITKCMFAAINYYKQAIECQYITRPAIYEEYILDKKVKDMARHLLSMQHAEIKYMYKCSPEHYADLMTYSNNICASYDTRPIILSHEDQRMFTKVYDSPKCSIPKVNL